MKTLAVICLVAGCGRVGFDRIPLGAVGTMPRPVLRLADPISGDPEVSYSEDVAVHIAGTDSAVTWCLLADDGGVVPRPVVGDRCFTPNPPVTVTLVTTGNRTVHLYVQDADGNTSTPGIASITRMSNSPPVAHNDDISTAVDTPVVIPVLVNDTDGNGDVLRVQSTSQPANGAVSIDAGQFTVTYTPTLGFEGTDQFTYVADDGRGASRVGTVAIHVVSMSPFVWLGAAGDGSWTTPGNWSGGAPPGSSDIAVFNDLCTSCDAQIDANIDVAGIRMDASYSGVITQAPTIAVTVGASGLHQEAGRFVGGDAPITIHGNLAVLGGELVSTTSELSVRPSVTSHNDEGFIIQGQLTHNDGTVVLGGSKGGALYNVVVSVDVDTRLVLNNLTLDLFDPASSHAYNGAVAEIATGDVVEVRGTLRLRDGKLMGGAIEIPGGDLVVECAGGGVCAEGGTTRVIMNGATPQFYRGEYPGTAPVLVIDNPTSVEPDAGVTSYSMSGLSVMSGTFVAPSGTLRFHIDREYGLSVVTEWDSFRILGGAYVNNVTRYDIDLWIGTDRNGNAFTIDTGAIPMPSLTVDLDDYNTRSGMNNEYITIAAGTVLEVAGAFTMYDGKLNGGSIEVGGDLTFTCASDRSCAGGGSTSIVINGSGDQVLSQSLSTYDAELPGAAVAVSKSLGVLSLATTVDLFAAAQSLELQQGTVDMAGRDLNVAGTLTLGGTLIQSGGTLSYGTLVETGGTILP